MIPRQNAEVFIQQQLRAIGVDVQIHNNPANIIFAPEGAGGLLASGKFDLAIYAWTKFPDPDDTDTAGPQSIPPYGANFSRVVDAELGRLQHAAESTYDRARRKALYAQIERRIGEVLPYHTIVWRANVDAWNDDLHGVRPAQVDQRLLERGDVDDLKPDWIRRSDALAEPVVRLYTLAAPEAASHLGLTQADAATTMFRRAGASACASAVDDATRALDAAGDDRRRRAGARRPRDPAAGRRTTSQRGIEIADAHLITLIDVARLAFLGLRVLLDEQNPPERKQLALTRLQRYAGLVDGVVPLTVAAERETRERLAVAGLDRPVRRGGPHGARARAGAARRGRRDSSPPRRSPAGKSRSRRSARSATPTRRSSSASVLPRARHDHRLPPEVYAFALNQVGVDIGPDELAARAHDAFDALQAEMQALAPRVAADLGIASTRLSRCDPRAEARADHRRRRTTSSRSTARASSRSRRSSAARTC